MILCDRRVQVKYLKIMVEIINIATTLFTGHSNDIWVSRPYHFKFFKGCLPQILLGPFLNTLTHIVIFFRRHFAKCWSKKWEVLYMLTTYIKNAEPSSHVVLNNYSPKAETHSDVTIPRLVWWALLLFTEMPCTFSGTVSWQLKRWWTIGGRTVATTIKRRHSLNQH